MYRKDGLPKAVVAQQLTRLRELHPASKVNVERWVIETIEGARGWTTEEFEAAVTAFIRGKSKYFPLPGQILDLRPPRPRRPDNEHAFPDRCIRCQVQPYEAGYEAQAGTGNARVIVRIRCGCDPRQAGWETPAARAMTEQLRRERAQKALAA